MILPNGKSTKQSWRYVRDWRKIMNDLCDALEYEYASYAFDPNITIKDKKGNLHDIPVEMAERIIELYRQSLVN